MTSDQENDMKLVDMGLSESIIKEEQNMQQTTIKEQEKLMREEAQRQFDSTVKDQRMKRLHFLLEKSGAYATILGRKLAKQQEEAREKAAQLDAAAAAVAVTTETAAIENEDTSENKTHVKSRRTRSAATKKRKTTDADYQLTDYLKEDVRVE